MSALVARGVTRGFDHPDGRVEVLRGVDLAVAAAEVVTVSGRSGSGKSALFAVLCGFDKPDAGTVEVCGAPLPAVPPWSDCGVLPQALGLAQELTLAENVALPLRLSGRRAEVADRVGELLAELGIAALADRYPQEVSYGQQQRAALARAVSARPAVLLADEPTAHLDHDSVAVVLGLLRRTAGEGTAVLVATHHDAVHRIADRELALAEGRIAAV
ncbi:ABC transporter ATP-binding protein [Actinokineospora globicatena]|uniref:ABC transporter ATP-binding protein n=1 Tax=Actinokineospora globicatena TaxID=103729 RepID=UPI0020A4EA5E|nr:ATP-binding cassette domain-containing protein [Actinokineospora globicatena]MCP2306668.1 putative ABC transport system ATP-binding protein [Actinokineospora globicatena]GLW82216.1 ABC transporter ATP-binding protein [Actinokineospora globicatena]GLW89009.1 ABC transporter ATP-binding protein [Actinokineospora globicatena]